MLPFAIFARLASRANSMLRIYTPELFGTNCEQVYQYVFDSYYGAGMSVYGAVG